WRRWAYFERRDDGWEDMIPYRSLGQLEKLITAPTGVEHDRAVSELKNLVLDAVSLSEGLRDTGIRGRYLALRVSRVKQAAVQSYRLFPREHFRVEVADVGPLSRYLEYAPDSVDLVAAEQAATVRLRISLDLLEMLQLIRKGYRPSPADLQGLFVNLLI